MKIRNPSNDDTNPHGITFQIAKRSMSRSGYRNLKPVVVVQIWQDMHPHTLARQASMEVTNHELGVEGKNQLYGAVADLYRWLQLNRDKIQGLSKIAMQKPDLPLDNVHYLYSKALWEWVCKFNLLLTLARRRNANRRTHAGGAR